jgi:hypothetical protein
VRFLEAPAVRFLETGRTRRVPSPPFASLVSGIVISSDLLLLLQTATAVAVGAESTDVLLLPLQTATATAVAVGAEGTDVLLLPLQTATAVAVGAEAGTDVMQMQAKQVMAAAAVAAVAAAVGKEAAVGEEAAVLLKSL